MSVCDPTNRCQPLWSGMIMCLSAIEKQLNLSLERPTRMGLCATTNSMLLMMVIIVIINIMFISNGCIIVLFVIHLPSIFFSRNLLCRLCCFFSHSFHLVILQSKKILQYTINGRILILFCRLLSTWLHGTHHRWTLLWNDFSVAS